MSEEEKTLHVEVIEATINSKMDRKMIPIYWMVGGTLLSMLTIFVSISIPLSMSLTEAVRQIEQKASKDEVKSVQSDLSKAVKESERDYLMKLDYYKLEADEHESLLEAFALPTRASYILDRINGNIRREFGFNYSTRGGSEK